MMASIPDAKTGPPGCVVVPGPLDPVSRLGKVVPGLLDPVSRLGKVISTGRGKGAI